MPAEPALKKIAQDNGIKGNGIEDLVHNDELNRIILRELQAAGKQGGLVGVEIIEGVVLADEEWTPANVRKCKHIIVVHAHLLCAGPGHFSSEDSTKANLKQIPE